MITPDSASLPRLLRGVGERRMSDLAEHQAVHGPLGDLRDWAPDRILAAVENSGLRGHGGAAFPAGRKMRAVAARRKPKILVANGTEGEPASKKDRVLLGPEGMVQFHRDANAVAPFYRAEQVEQPDSTGLQVRYGQLAGVAGEFAAFLDAYRAKLMSLNVA